MCTVLRFGGRGVTKRGFNENLQKYSLLISLYMSFRRLLRIQELATRCTDFDKTSQDKFNKILCPIRICP